MSTAAEPRTPTHEQAAVTAPPPAANGGAGSPAESVEPAPVEVVKASFNLPRRELDALKRIGAIRGVSATQALRQAIAILAFLVDLPRGSRLYVREPSGDQREIVFHNF